jgi:tRNA-2-methylthio-N6-dimethylallyladenosine synthase
MNQHDAEKIANLLHHAGYRPAGEEEVADLVLIHTCSVREKAEQKLYSELGALLSRKTSVQPELIVGVGGCVAQQEGAGLLDRFAALDFVFGSQNLRHVPSMVAGARERQRSLRVDYERDSSARFELPAHHPEYAHPTPGRAFVTVMEGCDLHCAFCVVPRTRGREVSRSSGAILEEIRGLVDAGVVEVTLLGQTVNAYGRPRPGRAKDEVPFAELLSRIDAIPGIERVRFTSPHPIFVTDELASLYGELRSLCPHVHLPVQSGSSRVLASMLRRYDRDGYLDRVAALRKARSDIAITTDLIVGFPGEADEDFAETLSLMRQVAFVDSFSFRYSPRPGTPVLRRELPEVPAAESQARLEALQATQRELTLAAHRARVGERCTVLVEGASRHGGAQQRGRCPKNRVVNFTAPAPRAEGALVEMRIAGATPHSLIGEVPAGASDTALPLV